MPNYARIIRNLEPEELDNYVREVIDLLSAEELKGYIPSRDGIDGLSEDQLRERLAGELGVADKQTRHTPLDPKAARQLLITILEEQEDLFAKAWDAEHDTGDWMHPDETDEEFFEHEYPNKTD